MKRSLLMLLLVSGLPLLLPACDDGGDDAPKSVSAQAVESSRTGPAAGTVSTRSQTGRDSKSGSPCSVNLWVADPDPKGLNVRGTAEKGAKIIGTLERYTEFEAVEAQNGRIRFKGPSLDFEPISQSRPQTGWVFGGLVGTGFRWRMVEGEQHLILYSGPSEDSGTIMKWVPSENGPYADAMEVTRVRDCSERWVKVDMKTDSRGKTYSGWVHPFNQCSSQVTTCP